MEKENKTQEKLVENVETIKSGEMAPDDDFDHKYHMVFDLNGNNIYDGHSQLHNESNPNK